MDAWVLNLDAELELATSGPYTPSRATERAVAARVEAASALLAPGDVLVPGDGSGAPGAEGLKGRAWCMTPRARRLLVESGATPVESPPVEVLRRVNGRSFAAGLGETLPGAAIVRDLDAWRAKVDEPASGHRWLSKRELGMAGRGRRETIVGGLVEADIAWARASLAAAPLRVEPHVAIELELAAHGWATSGGGGWRGPLCVQECDTRGVWLRTRVAAEGEVDADHRRRVVEEASGVADALAEAGYFGPFCVDAYLYRDGGGELRLNERGEINARYTMGWAVARGARAGR